MHFPATDLATDPVSNVRLKLCGLLLPLKRTLRLPADAQALELLHPNPNPSPNPSPNPNPNPNPNPSPGPNQAHEPQLPSAGELSTQGGARRRAGSRVLWLPAGHVHARRAMQVLARDDVRGRVANPI